MAKSPPQKMPDIELHPDAWERFERLIGQAASGGPKPKEPKVPIVKKTKKQPKVK